MKKELYTKVEIPEGVEVEINEDVVTVKGPEGENKREFNLKKLDIEKKGNVIILGHKKATKREKALMNTIAARIKNMILGVQEKYEYKMKICFSHFPITVEVQGENATIKNFLGEKVPRKVKILPKTDVQIKGQEVTITSTDKEMAGQTAGNFERATKTGFRDRRVFQDGIFLTNKAGREI